MKDKGNKNKQKQKQPSEPPKAQQRRQFITNTGCERVGVLLFFILAWLWASWWMGDVMRIAYERSFFAADATLMHWLAQKSFGWLWIIGRALLTLYHWPVVGGLLVAVLLTLGSWFTGYCLRLPSKFCWLKYFPAAAWMLWTADVGLNLYYMREPGRILGVPFLVVVILGAWAILSKVLSRRHSLSAERENKLSWISIIGQAVIIPICFAMPMLHLQRTHRYMRPLTHMQVQLLHNDYEGMNRTAHEHPDLCNRHVAGYYAIALARTGKLAEQLFDIRLEFDSIRAYGYDGLSNQCLKYHIVDCNYHAGLYRAARHYVMEALTVDGPSLYALKYLAKMALLDSDLVLARKYFGIIRKAPFEGEFIRKYEPMAAHPELVQADPEFAAVLKAAPYRHSFEQFFLKPGFLGYYSNLKNFKTKEALEWSTVACLYGKRMPDFLQRCSQFQDSALPKSIAEGLALQAVKQPELLQIFPQLELVVNRLDFFLNDASPYTQDKERGAVELFERYKGFYPYYYYFGNINNTHKPSEEELGHNNAGVN